MRDALRIFLLSLLAVAAGLALPPHFATTSATDSSPESEIRALLAAQTEAWNRGDIDAFMAGYWKSDQTAFVGASGLTRSWQAVLDRYHKNYPYRQAMGRLTFSDLEVHVLCPDAAFAIGQFHLQRANDQPAGIFTLYFRKFPEGWRIVADHTTAFPASTH
ncbi:MAG: nuclear transport factor 2 family protein [Candidatus Acidiferrales bacterium]